MILIPRVREMRDACQLDDGGDRAAALAEPCRQVVDSVLPNGQPTFEQMAPLIELERGAYFEGDCRVGLHFIELAVAARKIRRNETEALACNSFSQYGDIENWPNSSEARIMFGAARCFQGAQHESALVESAEIIDASRPKWFPKLTLLMPLVWELLDEDLSIGPHFELLLALGRTADDIQRHSHVTSA